MDQSHGSHERPKETHSEEFRRSVVDHLISSGKSAAQVAREFGITDSKLRVWKTRYGPALKAAAKAAGKLSREELARQNQQLRQELARVTLQRDILKKTILIVSEQSNRDIT